MPRKQISISDPDGELQQTIRQSIEKNQHRLYADELNVSALMRLLIKNLDVCIDAIRPQNPNNE